MRPSLTLVGATLVLLAGLTAAPGTSSATQSAPGASVTSSTLTSRPWVPSGLAKCTQITDAYCGRLEVPLDRTGTTPGTTTVTFWYYPATDGGHPRGTLVAHEGGPGYATSDSSDYYLDLFAPLRRNHAILLVDERGTGRSDPIDCPEAERYTGNAVVHATKCGRRLGARSDLYSTANAADDLAAVLDSLAIPKISLYGDSYGSFFSQTFTARYPNRVKVAIFDGTYPITDLDPWYLTSGQRLRENLVVSCRRSSTTCPVPARTITSVLARTIRSLRANPVTTTTPSGTGREITVTLTPRRVLDTLLENDTIPGYIRETPAALVAFNHHNPRPLARMVAEVNGASTSSSAHRLSPHRASYDLHAYSEGAYLAYACTDYPQLWDVNANRSTRRQQYEQNVADLGPSAVTPWTPEEWAGSEFLAFDYCIGWPKPSVAQPPFPGGSYPDVPVLVINGDLDLRTDIYQARAVADNFPNSTYVEVANYGHVTALYDPDRCASHIVRHFIRTQDAGDTACAAGIPEHRAVHGFARTAAGVRQAEVANDKDQSNANDRRAAYVAMESVADVMDRWYAIPGYTGGGLYGGRFSMHATTTNPFVSRVWTMRLKHIKWVRDITVTGDGTIPRANGTATMTLSLHGRGTVDGQLTMTWQTRKRHGYAHLTGSFGNRVVDLRAPSPSYY